MAGAAPLGDAGCDEVLAHLREHGYGILRGALPAELCDEVLAEIERLESLGLPPLLRNPFHGYKTVRLYGVLGHGEVWRRVATHPRLLAVIRAVLGRDCLLSSLGTSIVGPGERAQPIHVDDGVYTTFAKALRDRPRLYEGGPRQSIACNTVIALSDFTEELGATRVVPGSHRLPYPAPGSEAEWMRKSIPAVMPKGSILFFDGQCYHAGGANITEGQRRYAILANFCAGYLRPQENFVLGVPQEIAAAFPEELQALMGYRPSAGNLGAVFGHDPPGLARKAAVTGNLDARALSRPREGARSRL